MGPCVAQTMKGIKGGNTVGVKGQPVGVFTSVHRPGGVKIPELPGCSQYSFSSCCGKMQLEAHHLKAAECPDQSSSCVKYCRPAAAVWECAAFWIKTRRSFQVKSGPRPQNSPGGVSPGEASTRGGLHSGKVLKWKTTTMFCLEFEETLPSGSDQVEMWVRQWLRTGLPWMARMLRVAMGWSRPARCISAAKHRPSLLSRRRLGVLGYPVPRPSHIQRK
ncbi:hypothetical protein O3P69_015706 [Scylla paramamosain]|uniref:Uncharacterized protein n=1 Tax=Scylla paramamosain TaxID=85552 RepID=A0AAW0S906_SCYPA